MLSYDWVKCDESLTRPAGTHECEGSQEKKFTVAFFFFLYLLI